LAFTSLPFLCLLIVTFVLYWSLPFKTSQNILLLISSYIFYGYIHPWFCILLVISTVTDYFCGIQLQKNKADKHKWLIISLVVNLGMLCAFKYFNFFIDNVYFLIHSVGLNINEWSLKILLPVGISFYTFQTLSYTIDIYRGKIRPCRQFIDFACFVSFFPQLVAGPIERASHMLPQLVKVRKWKYDYLFEAWPLFVRGFLKKIMIADNIAILVNKIFMLESPGMLMLICGGLTFALQIYADFSAYTDIARATGKLFGIELMKNFNAPYLAISPSDFWRRWHISFSSWIRDYLYIPLGGSRVDSKAKLFFVLLTTMGLAGLWHGAAWHFVVWGLYHGLLIFTYHLLGKGGQWQPTGRWGFRLSWSLMFIFTIFGWLLFRTPDLNWITHAFFTMFTHTYHDDQLATFFQILALTLFYAFPFFIFMLFDKFFPKLQIVHAVFYGIAITAMVIFHRSQYEDFIYFQF